MSPWRLPVGAAIIVHVAIVMVPVFDPAAPSAPAVLHLRLAAAASPPAPTPTPAATPTPTAAPTPRAVRKPLRPLHSEPVTSPAPAPPPRAELPPPPGAVASAPNAALPRGLATAPPPAPTAPAPAEVDLSAYAATVRSRVASHKRYPRRAQRLGASGTATIAVAINSAGKLAAPPRLAHSSGSDLLDREALRMAGTAAPFPAPPSGARVDIEVPVRFTLP